MGVFDFLGGIFGENKQTAELPWWLENASLEMLGRADDASRIGYIPWQGPDVAAFSPMQQAAFDNTNQMAAAFGMGGGRENYMPKAQDFGGGVEGYSSFPLYNQQRREFRQDSPNQYGSLMQHLVKPNGSRFKPNGMLRNGGNG